MVKVDFSKRLRAVIEQKGIRQSELCEITGIGKSAMSQYLSGSFKPKQQNLYKLAKALDVSEAWLMGYDVPIERTAASAAEGEAVYLQAVDDSMINAHIPCGAIVLVERCETALNGQIIACMLQSSILIRRFIRSGNQVVLLPENLSFQPISLAESELCQKDFTILGVVKQIIINLESPNAQHR